MANTNAPFGFMPIGRQDGAAWTANNTSYKILAAESTAIYKGDPVVLGTDGYLVRATAGTSPILGIFGGCKYLASAVGFTRWSPYWPGSGATASTIVTAYVYDDPSLLFEVQATSTAITQTNVGQNVQFALGTGSALTGLSGATVESPADTSTLPFRVQSLIEGVGPGSDAASSYNRVIVAWNNSFFKQLTGMA